MSVKVPQYSDIILSFENINDGSGIPIDLSSTSEIIVSIAAKKISNIPLEIKYSITPGVFIIDNVNKKISVKLTTNQVGNTTGKYYVNLWIQIGSRFSTHLTQNFDVVPSVSRA